MAHPLSLDKVIPDTLKEFGMDKKARTYSVLTSWPQIMGEKIANATHPEKLDRGILTVRVKSPAWRYELQMQKPSILAKLAEVFGEGVVRDIQLK